MVSVIIPIYNTGKYLDKCLYSVSNQSYRDLEIILVNDCSSDKATIEIIQKWQKRDHRINLIDKQVNEGVDKARVSGIYASHGEYLTFVDSDDWLPLDAFESMMQKMLATGSDIVKGNMADMWFGGFLKKVSAINSSLAEREILHDELMEEYYLSFFGVNIISVSLCASVFKKSLFLEAVVQPSGLRFGEDLVMNLKVFPYAQKFYQMDKVVYYYRQGLPTMSSKYLNNWLPNFNSLYKIKMKQIEITGYTKAIFYQKIELINYLKSFVIGCNRYRKNRIPECINELKQELQDPIYRNLVSSMKSDKWIKMAEMLEQGDAALFWSAVTEQQKQEVTFKMKVVNCALSTLSRVKA